MTRLVSTAQEDREVNRLTVNSRLAAETQDLETCRINYGRLVRLYAESYARWVRGRRRGAEARLRALGRTPRRRAAG